jgi:hypothetical protein
LHAMKPSPYKPPMMVATSMLVSVFMQASAMCSRDFQ